MRCSPDQRSSCAPSRVPFVDEHALVIDAPPETVWDALLAHLSPAFEGGASEVVARLLGCEHPRSGGPRPLEPGSTFPGFVVATVQRPLRLGLEGRHRFSQYRLEFALDDLTEGRTRLRAGTWAAFPGARGRAYRAAVIGTRGHVLVVRRMLGAVGHRARRATGALA